MAIFIGTALKFAADVAIDRLKKKVKKPKRKSGKEMASSIVKREEKPKAIVKSISTTKLLSIKPVADVKPTKLSKESSGIVVIDDALDRIDSILLDCLQTIKASDKLKKKTLFEERKKQSKKQKKKRESILEKASSFIGGVGAKGINALKNTGIFKWLNNVVLGSLVLFILNNWTFIIEQFQKAWEQIKKIWEAFKPIFETTWNALKWIVTAAGGGDLIRRGENLLRAMQGKPLLPEDTADERLAKKLLGNPEQPKPEGFWRGLAGFADVMTNDTFDFDNRGIVEGEEWLKQLRDIRENRENNFSLGGRVFGPPGVDKVLAKLTSGEFVMSVRAVNMWGDILPYMNALGNQGKGIKSPNMNALGNQGKGIKSPTSNDSLLSNNIGNMKIDIESGGIFTPLKEQKRVGDRSGMLMTQASYEMTGGTTVVMITGNDSPPQDSGEGGIELLPLPMVNSGDYTLPFRTELQKFG